MLDTQLFCKALKFAAHAAGKKDIRYYLVGVRLEWSDDRMHLVGTDGNRAAVIEMHTNTMAPVGHTLAATIGLPDAKRILQTFGKDKGQVEIQIIAACEAGKPPSIQLKAGGAMLEMLGVEGIYPDWRRIVPSNTREIGVMPGLDAALLAEACDALAPFCLPIKTTRGLRVLAGPGKGDTVVVRPVTVETAHVLRVLTVIAPTKGDAA